MTAKTFKDVFRQGDQYGGPATYGEKVGKYILNFLETMTPEAEEMSKTLFGAYLPPDVERLDDLIASLKSLADQMRQ